MTILATCDSYKRPAARPAIGLMAFGRRRPPRNLRALFLSDIHLGSRACRSDRLIEFLRHHRADAIYLVGDIVDGWRLRANWYRPTAHDEILRELLHAAQQGVRVTYVPGNHDEFLRDYCGTHFAGIEVVESTIHTAADGRRYIVVHGDRFDRLVDRTRRLAPIAHRANLTVIAANSVFNRMRRWFGLPSWPLLQWAKHKFKTASSYLGDFERSLAELARQLAADGVICGHVHHAAIHERFGIRYINCGDWVESCTAVAECHDGRFEILRWFGETSRYADVTVTDEVQAA
jgi:UDP-2,3-diacylglucosamine pyrophosphatase LpxH